CSLAVPVSSIHDLRSEELLGCETMRACLVHRQGPGASSSGAHAQNNERLLAATLSGALFRRERLPVPVSMKRWLFFVCCIANPIQRRAVVFRRPGFSFTPPTSSSRYPPGQPRDRRQEGLGYTLRDREIGDEMKLKFQKLTVCSPKLLQSTISANNERRKEEKLDRVVFCEMSECLSTSSSVGSNKKSSLSQLMNLPFTLKEKRTLRTRVWK
ncbi:hypothetical protein K0M31_007371, partial [Melipona bicolor]